MTSRTRLRATAAGLGAFTAMLLAPCPAGATTLPSQLAPGHSATSGAVLRSPNGHFLLQVEPTGRLTITGPRATVWATHTHGQRPVLVVRRNGDVQLLSHRTALWQTATTGAGASTLRLGDNGVLTLSNRSGTVWTSVVGNRCAHSRGAHHVLIDISTQSALLCAHQQQILITPVTTGASDRGDGTPTGTWHLYAKQRNTVLHPASGGAYPVKYWMPYNGAYGMHDARWQKFPFGSGKYRTQGSHGCTHFPTAAMARLFAWAPIGTTVTVRR